MPQVHSSSKHAVDPAKLLAQLFAGHRPSFDHRSHFDNLVEGVAPHLADVVVPGFNEARDGRQADKGNAARVGVPGLRVDEGGLVVDYVAMSGWHGQATAIHQLVSGTPIFQQGGRDWLSTREKSGRGDFYSEDRGAHSRILAPAGQRVVSNVERVEAQEAAEVAA